MPPGGMGPTQEGGWRGQGLGRATWSSGLVVAPLVSHGCPLVAFYLKTSNKFFCNFLGNFTVENFSKFKKLQKLS